MGRLDFARGMIGKAWQSPARLLAGESEVSFVTGVGRNPKMARSAQASTKGPAVPRACIFCQQPGRMTKEHIWGDWLKAHIAPTMNKHNMQAVRINQPGQPTTGNTLLRAGDPLRSTVRVVCADCNNQWLSGIQSRAKPILIPLIKGDRTVLGIEAQQRVSAWCAMATMTAEFIDRDPNTIAVPQADRDWLRNNGTAPPGWRIWLARYRRHKWPAQWAHFTLPILEAKDVPAPGTGFVPPNTQVTTFVVGELYVHVMSSVDLENINGWATRLSFSERRLVCIHPAKESFIVWPAPSLTDKDADNIASAFHRYVEGISRSLSGRRLF